MESAVLLRKVLLEDSVVSERKPSETDRRLSDDGWTILWDLIGRLKGALEVEKEEGPTTVPRQNLLPGEITLQLEGRGAFRYRLQGWTGSPESGGSIEAFGVRLLEKIKPEHIEYKAIGPGGRETPWVSDAKLCGTRGKGIPLCGFAVRLAPHLINRYGVVYEGSFRKSGVAGPVSEGVICKPSVMDDPLMAINLRIFERGAS